MRQKPPLKRKIKRKGKRCERCEFPFDADLPRHEDSVDFGEKRNGEWIFYERICVECVYEMTHGRQNNCRPMSVLQTTYQLTTPHIKTERGMNEPKGQMK